ncbi:MAG TPA: FkbM family methyltransferase [Acidimicrobiales bacterium]
MVTTGQSTTARLVDAVAYRARTLVRRTGVDVVRTNGAGLLRLHVDQVFARYGINVVFDVGAHHGEYGVWLRRNGYRGWIASFEPVAANIAALRRRSAGDGRWLIFPTALGAAGGRAEINVARNSVFSSFLGVTAYATDTFGTEPEVAAIESVEVATLDDVAGGVLDRVALDESTQPRAYLKLDTQGWDLEVLKGGNRTLGRTSALQTEVSCQPVYREMPTMATSIETLRAHGFSVSGLFPVTRDATLRVVELDCVAVRG